LLGTGLTQIRFTTKLEEEWTFGSRNSPVSRRGYGLGERGSISGTGRDLSIRQGVQTSCWTNPSS